MQAGRVICLFAALLVAAPSKAADPYTTFLEQQFATPGPAQSSQAIANQKIADLESALAKERQLMAEGPLVAEPPASHDSLFLEIALLLGAALLLRKGPALFNAAFNSWKLVPAGKADLAPNLLLEDPSLAAFFITLRATLTGPAPYPAGPLPSPAGLPLQTSQEKSSNVSVAHREFFASAPKQLAALRRLFSQISRAPADAARQNSLLELSLELHALKENSSLPEVVPVWQLASALEGLVKQLSSKASNVTPSAFRSIAGAIDLLEALCLGGVPSLPVQPVRLLVVDDDSISRRAICFALKKAFNEPDVAQDGPAALALASGQTYDVIFLDVEMPGMDGFELCSKIHGTGPNRTTPVVFITSHSDFNARATSALTGGHDLIGKPFLSFEITVKALTCVLSARLQNARLDSRPAAKEASRVISQAALAEPTVSSSTRALPSPANSGSLTLNSRDEPGHNPGKRTQHPDTITNPFLGQVPAHLKLLRNHAQGPRPGAKPASLQRLLGKLFVGVHSLVSESGRADLQALSNLASALEGMLKKLLEHPKLRTPSTLATVVAALELLHELCLAGSHPDLTHPPIRLLVVDDDPIARRALSGSLQVAFGKPEHAESGEAALALAAQKPFDLVFLDVLMPGMDGFTTCSKLHQTAANKTIPVIFVTSNDALDSRAPTSLPGGFGFIPKPVLSSQIILAALTLILRSRLAQSTLSHPLEATVCE